MKTGRDYAQKGPLEWFSELYQGIITTRNQLRKQDVGLYQKLLKEGLLDQVLPNKQVQRDFTGVNLIDYFNQHYKDTITTRAQLQKQDVGLYNKLRKEGLLHIVIPEKRAERDYTNINPIDYFNKHYQGTITTRSQLEKQDDGLYQKLLKEGLLDKVLPEKRETRDFTDVNLIDYFNQHYQGTITTRKQLEKQDVGLYKKLDREGLLDKVLPEKQVQRDFTGVNLIDYFNQHCKGITARSQLEKQDSVFYEKLRKAGLLDQVLPNKQEQRDFTGVNLIDYFNQHYQGTITTRAQLAKQDGGLYQKIRKEGLLEKIFPKDNGLDDILRDYAEGDQPEGEEFI